jgi:hypothetical protein
MVDVKVLEIDVHVPCTWGGNDAVEVDLDGAHISSGCTDIARIDNAITTSRESDTMGLFLL